MAMWAEPLLLAAMEGGSVELNDERRREEW
jgi:hypothetical protein